MEACSNCNAPLIPELKFCTACGTPRAAQPPPPVAAPRACQQCGTPLGPDQRFCGNCGTPAPAPGAPPAASSPSASVSGSVAVPPPPPAPSAPSPAATPSMTPVTGAKQLNQSVLFALPSHAASQLQGLLSGCIEGTNGRLVLVTFDDALQQVQSALRSQRFDAVCIIGNSDDIPHAEVEDETHHDDAILTDNFYGMIATPSEDDRYAGEVLPETPVTRIPSLDPHLIRRLLNVGDSLHPSWSSGVAVSAHCWRGASEAVLNTIAGRSGPRLQLSPPNTVGELDDLLAENVGRLYFNVHGTDQAPVWVGDDGMGGYPVILKPPAISIAENAIVMSEACYGARVVTDEDAISLTFLEQGAGCFVGSTIIAWGPAEPPTSLADVIIEGTYESLDRGNPLGLALLEAKMEILDRHLDAGEVLSPQAHNTLLSFVAYGSPFASTGVSAKSAPRIGGGTPATKSPTLPSSPGSGSVLDRVRGRMNQSSGSGTSTDASPLARYRERNQRRLPPGARKLIQSGQQTVNELSSRFRTYSQIQRNLHKLLGSVPDATHTVDYQSGQHKRTVVIASVPGNGFKKSAALVLDENGQTLSMAVSR